MMCRNYLLIHYVLITYYVSRLYEDRVLGGCNPSLIGDTGQQTYLHCSVISENHGGKYALQLLGQLCLEKAKEAFREEVMIAHTKVSNMGTGTDSPGCKSHSSTEKLTP